LQWQHQYIEKITSQQKKRVLACVMNSLFLMEMFMPRPNLRSIIILLQ